MTQSMSIADIFLWALIWVKKNCKYHTICLFECKDVWLMKYRGIKKIYGENVMYKASLRKWWIMFNEQRLSIDTIDCSGQTLLVSETLMKEVNEQI